MNEFHFVSNSSHGYDAQDFLQNKLLKLRNGGYVSLVVKTYRAGDPNAKNSGQFYAPFMVQFNNGVRWIIFSTTSCRTDRIKGQQWDADNLKKLDPTIERAILTYPDDVDETNEIAFKRQKEKYDSGIEISRLDDIIPNEVLVNQIQKKARDIFYEQEEHESVDITRSIVEEGREYDFNGRAFEKDVANLLNNESYLQMLKNGATDCSDWKFSCFSKMIKSFGLIPTDIIRIEATSEKEVIGLLPSGGQPKTDVWAIIFLTSGEKQNITISCKRTIRDSVSVHQYTADKFADVLDPNNDSLRVLLNIFQFYANARDMPNADRIALETLLQPLLPKLCRWVLGGFGGDCSSPIQYANYLISYNPTIEYFGIHSVEDYTKMLLKHSPLAFGTPFGWTYASKQRQRSIQLKMPIIRDE